jgi:hypothetical protein
MVYCEKCNREIPQRRIEAFLERTGQLPTTCVNCSNTRHYIGFQVFGHKTGGTCIVIDPKNREMLRQAVRADKRAR